MPRTSALSIIVLTLLTLTSGVLAQEQSNLPPNAPAQNTLVAYGVGVVCAVAIIAVSILSAKRTHRD